MVRVEQVQPWEGGGAGYLSQGTMEEGGSEGEKIMSHGIAVQCPYQICSLSDLPVSLILALIVWMKGSKLSYR